MKKQRQAYSMTDSPNNTSKASPPTGGESISKNGRSNQPNRIAHNAGSSKRTDRQITGKARTSYSRRTDDQYAV